MKVIEVSSYGLKFEDSSWLISEHEQDCCENHWLDFNSVNIYDFDNLDFDLSNEGFFERIPDFGIALIPIKGWPVRIPGYGSNNGYYSSNLDLVLLDKTQKTKKVYSISECQVISD